MEDFTFRVALIGCGSISENHICAILSAGQKICAFCDIVKSRAERAAQKYQPDALVFTDYEELLKTVHPDVVHICTPHGLHAQMIVAALRQNIHVLCEKPLCIQAEELEQIRLAVEMSHATLGICHQNRYEPNMLLLKELAKEGVSGGFGSVVWSRDEAYYRSGDWRGKWETEGGGVLINQALHTLDLLQWVCGMPETVTAHIFNDHLKGKIEVEDTASVLFSLKNGAHLHFFATTAASVDFPVQLQLVLKDGTVLLAQNNILARNGQVVTSNDIKGVTIGKQVWGNGHQRLISDFYHCLSEGKAFPIGFQEAQCVIRLILAIYQSNGHPIDVSDSPTKV